MKKFLSSQEIQKYAEEYLSIRRSSLSFDLNLWLETHGFGNVDCERIKRRISSLSRKKAVSKGLYEDRLRVEQVKSLEILRPLLDSRLSPAEAVVIFLNSYCDLSIRQISKIRFPDSRRKVELLRTEALKKLRAK